MSGCRRVAGIVIKEGTTQPQVGLTVRLLGKARGRGTEEIGSCRTSAKGRFVFDLSAVSHDDHAGFYDVQVFDGAIPLTTHGHTTVSATTDSHELVVCVEWPVACAVLDETPPGSISGNVATNAVHGIVRHADGTPLVGLKVDLYEVGFALGEEEDEEVKITSTAVDTLMDGWFSIGTVSSLPRDIYVQVWQPGSPPRTVGRSSVRYGYNGGALRFLVTVCDEALRGPSEFSRLSIELSKAIFGAGGSHPNAGLGAKLLMVDTRRVAWLAARSGWSMEQVADRAVAQRLSDEMSASGSVLTPEAVYGLLRMGFPRSRREILARPPSRVGAALSQARKTNIIGLGVVVQDVLEVLVEALARAFDSTESDSLRKILRTSQELAHTHSLDDTQISEFCTLFAEFDGTDAEFWTDVAGLAGWTTDDVTEAKRLIRLGMIGLGHAPTVLAILKELGEDPVEDVGSWDLATWQVVAGSPSVETDSVSPLPEGLEGDNDTERRAALLTLLRDHGALAFPARALRTALLGDAGVALEVDTILSRSGNGTVDLRTARLSLTAGLDLGTGVEDEELDLLRTAQRLVRLVPVLDAGPALQRLAETNLRSARDVVSLGRTRFLDIYAEGDPVLESQGQEILAAAQSQAAVAAAFYLTAHPALGQADLAFVPSEDVSVSDAEIPAYGQMFVSPVGTRCAWCQSIHGPSAYLVDLLHWLSKRTPPTGSMASWTSALDALLDRRPDLAHLPLTCENAERVLPYIDLSLEVLEAVVVGSGLSTAHSSEVATAEMLASPQYTTPEAYAAGRLGDATQSFMTPFHLPLVTARTFLRNLDIDRGDLMRAFNAGLTADDIAVEDLGLSEEGAGAITGSDAEGDYWSIPVPAATAEEVTVRAFCRATGVTYVQLLDLLHTRLANPYTGEDELEIRQIADADPYDIASYVLMRASGTTPPYTAPEPVQFTAMRRVLRLWRATGWSLLDLDRVCGALGHGDPTTWSSTTLLQVSEVLRLSRLTGLTPVELSGWFGSLSAPHGRLDTYIDRDTQAKPSPSLYDRTWLNPSLFPLVVQQASGFPFALNAGRDEVAAISPPLLLADHLAQVRAVLQVSESELTALITALEQVEVLDLHDPGDGDVPSITLHNLGLLFRWCSLGRVLKLLPTEVLRLADLFGVPPDGSGSPNAGPFNGPYAMLQFLDRVHPLLASGWTVDEVDYVVRHHRAERVAPTDDWIRGVLGRLRDTVSGLDGASAEAERLDAVARQLSEEFGISRAAMDFLATRVVLGAAYELGASEPVPSYLFLAADSHVDLTASSPVTAGACVVTLTADVETSGGTRSAGTTITLPIATVLGGASLVGLVSAGTLCTASADLELDDLPASIAAATPVTVASTTAVTWEGGSGTLSEDAEGTLDAACMVNPPVDASAVLANVTLLTRFLRTEYTAGSETGSGSDPWADIDRNSEDWHEDFAIIEGLWKALFLIDKVQATADELDAWNDRAAEWSLLAPATLTAGPSSLRLPVGGDAAAMMELWTTVRLFLQRSRLPGSTPSFAEVLVDPSAEVIAERTGWEVDHLSTLIDTGITSVEDMVKVLDQMGFIRKGGATPEVVASWAAPGSLGDFEVVQSDSIVQACRSTYATEDAWAKVARLVRDPIRKAQRDALVDYLIAEGTGTFQDADDVYQHYLIDVSMNPELLTSRIVQASATVQLFVHRALFGLEGEEVGECFNDEDRVDWEWRRTYRVWEAARKVFLYPENWIEPELRDDKSPFFETMESELAQGDATDKRVEEVTLAYLSSVLEVANLQVLACHAQREDDTDGSIDRFHVFARTRSVPATYWYRCRIDSSTWTSWQEVACGVVGDHLIPVVYNRRLMLFWAEFTEASAESEESSPNEWWEIRLGMSEFSDGAWSAKVLGAQAMALSSIPHYAKNDTSRYHFVSSISHEGMLSIRCLATRTTPGEFSQSIFYDLGKFTLNPCTLDFEVETLDVQLGTTRLATDRTLWSAPRFQVSQSPTDGLEDLDVYVGTVDDEGTYTGNASAVELLTTIPDAWIVVPSQWQDFVSQSPFFVGDDERVYFVEPFPPESDGLEASASSDAPSLSAVYSYRSGTRAVIDQDENETIDDEQADALIPYVAAKESLSASEAVSRLRAIASSLGGSSSADSLVEVLGSYRFWPFYHPYACRFIKEVRRGGVMGLLDPAPAGMAGDLFRQAIVGAEGDFEGRYGPTAAILEPYPVEEIDFSLEGAYSLYNWETFFHLPFYLAVRLADAGRFQESINWFHCIFDPRTRTSAEESGFSALVDGSTWWKVKPFLEPTSAPVTNWIAFTGEGGDTDAAAAFEAQVAAWAKEPFNPHALARLRPGTYQRALVMRYLDTLLAWGDALFSRDTLESINEATQIYVYARQLLGDRPALLEDAERPEPKSYDQLKDDLDSFSNALVAIENAAFTPSGSVGAMGGSAVVSTIGQTTYFCVPFNTRLLSFWDTAEDRLFKIRNGMNIAGVVRSLPLFQPPIDPAMLVRAAAAGIDIGTALADQASVGHYRFSTMHGRAQALAGTVRSLGQGLLSALEKRDAEALALLRQTHEAALLAAVRDVREQQLDEAREALEGLRKSQRVVEARHAYYERLIETGWIKLEEHSVELTKKADSLQKQSSRAANVGSVVGMIPDFEIGGGLPKVHIGGSLLSRTAMAFSGFFGSRSARNRAEAGMMTTRATYRRRAEEWKHQSKVATLELQGLERQIAGAEIRVEIARREVKNQELQIRHSAEVREWMERKFTNKQLFDWMAGQLSTLHFQTWQLAHSTAKIAEACYNHELGRGDTFVQAVHWDGSRKGLLAGERLQLDLERMDLAYLTHDARPLELVKHISIARLDPLALVRLREEGECYVDLPEVLFDLDCPGHVDRRIVSVAVTVACVSGSTGQVNLRLTLHNSAVRASAEGALASEVTTAYPSIVTSSAIEDGGLFSNDPQQPRYLPFERRGAVSSWHLAFANQDYPQFDWQTVGDVVLHLRYTARDGGEVHRAARNAAISAELALLTGGFTDLGETATSSRFTVAISARRDDPDAWALAQDENADEITLSLVNRLPYFATGKTVAIERVHVALVGVAGTGCSVDLSETALTLAQWPAGSVHTFVGSSADNLADAWPDDLNVSGLVNDTTAVDLNNATDLVVVLEVSVT